MHNLLLFVQEFSVQVPSILMEDPQAGDGNDRIRVVLYGSGIPQCLGMVIRGAISDISGRYGTDGIIQRRIHAGDISDNFTSVSY